MLKSEVIDFSTQQKYTISYFEDDTVNLIRQRIAIAMDSHPDRLFILISLKLPHDYYQKNRTRWESLFERLSYNNQPITTDAFQEYLTVYRNPQVNLLNFSDFDKTEWLSKPEDLEEVYLPTQNFTEYRIFGVEESNSFILPMKFNKNIALKIPAARTPLPMISTLFSTFYKHGMVEKFLVIPYDSQADSVASIYYPFYRSTTPSQISDEEVSLISKNTKLIKDLLELKINDPKSISVYYVKFYTKLIDTDFGAAARTRFEQIFYGLTVSKEVPYIQYYTGKNETSRHKFYVEDPKTKKPYLDMNNWKVWNRPPQRNIPTLLLYRGTSKNSYDRISITPEDITITLHRDDESSEKIPEMKKEVLKWFKEFDAITAFVEKSDIDSDRWDLQRISFIAKYTNKVDDIDPRRLNCISSIFNKTDNPAKFAFLRTDSKVNYKINPLQVKILQLKNQGVVKPEDIAKEVGIGIQETKNIIEQVKEIVNDDPNILDSIFKDYPSITIGQKDIRVVNVNELERISKYASIFRYIIGFADDPKLDAICPKRMEIVKSDTGIAPVETFADDVDIGEDYGDLFGYLEEEVEPEKDTKKEEVIKEKKISTIPKETTLHSYFQDQLIKFDPESFEPKNNEEIAFSKSCNRNYQPIILDQKFMKKYKGTEFDPQTYLKDEFMEDTVDPEGLIICPEYWCMEDEIPLTKEQLVEDEGELVCPFCYKKIRTSDRDSLQEYAVIRRKDKYKYPGFKKDKFTKTGKRMPCCFSTPHKSKTDEKVDEKYYIVNQDKLQLKPFQTAFVNKSLLESLNIDEKYEIFAKKRIANGMSGFFRVGLGNPSETLPELLNLKIKIARPLESVNTVLKCSFLRSWKKMGTSNLPAIENALRKIPPYDTDDYVRKNLASIISGIDEAYDKKELTILEELEYACVFLQCDVFRIFTNTNKLGCVFYSPLMRARTRGIIILQNNNTIDILSNVTRISRGFQYKSNVFEIPFKKDTYVVLEKLRNESCNVSIPSYDDALKIIKEILVSSEQNDFEVVLDPFGRGQAFFVKNVMILPFNPIPLPNMIQTKIMGYNDINKETLPTHENVLKYLEIASKYTDGYTFVEDLQNSNSERVEVILKSGLRIPVYPEKTKTSEPLEIIETVNQVPESKLVFGGPSEDLEKDYKQLSYASEIYEFLLFELTNDIKEDYKDLKVSLQQPSINRKEVEPLLREWFDKTIEYVQVDKPIEFLSKVRTPCGQFKSKDTCSGNLCAWDGKTCKVEVRQSVKKEPLFHRLLATLVDNSKIRAMVLDGRTSPFFSTVLYLSLPNELIVTTSDILDINF